MPNTLEAFHDCLFAFKLDCNAIFVVIWQLLFRVSFINIWWFQITTAGVIFLLILCIKKNDTHTHTNKSNPVIIILYNRKLRWIDQLKGFCENFTTSKSIPATKEWRSPHSIPNSKTNRKLSTNSSCALCEVQHDTAWCFQYYTRQIHNITAEFLLNVPLEIGE